MNNLRISLKQLEVQEIEFNLRAYLVIAMQRTEMEMKNLDSCIEDIISEFSYLNLYQIKEALRKGSLANYGRSYKLSTQEVCFWIREYLKENKSKELKI